MGGGEVGATSKKKKRGKIQAIIDLTTSNIPRFSTLLLKKSTAVVMSWNRWKVAARHSTTATSNTYLSILSLVKLHALLALWLFYHSPPPPLPKPTDDLLNLPTHTFSSQPVTMCMRVLSHGCSPPWMCAMQRLETPERAVWPYY